MKNTIKLLAIALFAVALMTTGCKPKDSILVSSQNLWFSLEAGSQTIDVTANCEWTVNYNDDADWYTVTPEGGKKDGTITVTVKAYPNGDYRGSSFVITSPGGHIRRTVFVMQNKLDFDGIKNKVFAVTELEHWNTDYFGQIIEDSYRHFSFNPYDTTQGYQMFFYDNGTGLQRDRHGEAAVWYAFTYEYDPINSILHIEFETAEEAAPESYNAQVLCASDSLYRIFHEYKTNFWERADHRKIGTINPGDREALMKGITVRKKKEGIYHMN